MNETGPLAMPPPDIRSRLDRIVLMGGAISEGNMTPSAEFNVWVDPLVDLAKEGRLRKIEPQRIDGLPDLETPRADRLREAGFFDSYRGLVLRG